MQTHARELLNEFVQQRPFCQLKGIGIVDNCVAFDQHHNLGSAHRGFFEIDATFQRQIPHFKERHSLPVLFLWNDNRVLQRHEFSLAYDKRIIACGRNAKTKLNEHIAIAVHIIELIVIYALGARDGVALGIHGNDFSML